MILSGRTIETTLGYTVHSINGVDNRFSGPQINWKAHTEFYELLKCLQQIPRAGALGIHIDDKKQLMLFFQEGKSAEADEHIARVKDLLGLNPERMEFPIRYGAFAKDDSEIAILTRSMLEVITDLSSSIDIPTDHVLENRAYQSSDEDREGYGAAPLRAHSDKQEPTDAYVSVFYKGRWFWIEDTDFESKRTLSMLVTFFALTEPDTSGTAPIITIQ